jgi:hypothetical protein
MNRRDRAAKVFYAVAVVVCVIVLLDTIRDRSACHERGGELFREFGSYSYTCGRLQSIRP